MRIVLIVIVVLAILLFIYFSIYNRLIRLRNGVDEAYATIDVYLKKRFDLIPNLVSTVKGYAKHESETLEKVIGQRAGNSFSEKAAQDAQITGAIRNLFAVAENYPDLKANTNFMDLQNQLKAIEVDIANARKYYNANVREFNTAIEVFPNSIVAGMGGFTKRPMYEIENAQERDM